MFSQMIDLMLYETDCYNNILYLEKYEQTEKMQLCWISAGFIHTW